MERLIKVMEEVKKVKEGKEEEDEVVLWDVIGRRIDVSLRRV